MRVGFEPTPFRTRLPGCLDAITPKRPGALVWRLRPLGHLTDAVYGSIAISWYKTNTQSALLNVAIGS